MAARHHRPTASTSLALTLSSLAPLRRTPVRSQEPGRRVRWRPILMTFPMAPPLATSGSRVQRPLLFRWVWHGAGTDACAPVHLAQQKSCSGLAGREGEEQERGQRAGQGQGTPQQERGQRGRRQGPRTGQADGRARPAGGRRAAEPAGGRADAERPRDGQEDGGGEGEGHDGWSRETRDGR
jgi:hypothetical protein